VAATYKMKKKKKKRKRKRELCHKPSPLHHPQTAMPPIHLPVDLPFSHEITICLHKTRRHQPLITSQPSSPSSLSTQNAIAPTMPQPSMSGDNHPHSHQHLEFYHASNFFSLL